MTAAALAADFFDTPDEQTPPPSAVATSPSVFALDAEAEALAPRCANKKALHDKYFKAEPYPGPEDPRTVERYGAYMAAYTAYAAAWRAKHPDAAQKLDDAAQKKKESKKPKDPQPPAAKKAKVEDKPDAWKKQVGEKLRELAELFA